ncbi:MAG: AprI/Inh family metalloprotease inhibitor [Proteobacteria bacterium]|nr:AprI/Inh family metalloprotease inhibitor [Pseudomonadota bacterium]
MSRRLALFAAVAALATTPAAADPAPAWAKPYIGAWTLSGASEGGFACVFQVLPEPGIGGMQVKMSPACRKNFPVEDAAAFTEGPNHELLLIDPLRHPVLRFKRAGEDWVAQRPNGQGDDIVLNHSRAEGPRVLTYPNTWSLSGPDNAQACGFVVNFNARGSGSMHRAGRCDPRWADLKPVRWRLRKAGMTLLDKAGHRLMTLKGPDDFNVYVREDAKGGPVFFGPGVVVGP